MPLDPSIFTNYANIRANQNAQLGANIGNAIENVQRQRMFNQAQELEQRRYDEQMALKREELSRQGLDLDKIIPSIAVKSALYGPESLSQEERAFGQAYDMLQSSKVAFDPLTKEPYSPYRPIFTKEPAGFNYPVVQQPVVESSPLGGAPMEGATTGAQGGLDMTNILPAGATRQTQQTAQEEVVKQNIKEASDIRASEREKASEKPMDKSAVQKDIIQGENINSIINDAKKMVSGRTTGKGSAIGEIPLIGRGTKAYDLKAMVETIRSDAAINNIQQMRKDSPTGAAVGNASNADMDLLKDKQRSLDVKQSPEQFLKNLDEYQKQRNKVLFLAKDAYFEKYGEYPDFGFEGRRVRDKVTGQMGTFVNGQFVPE